MSSVLKINNLTHQYGGNTPFMNVAIKNINLEINKGEIVGIIGHTGSGKSTLIQHLNGLLKPTEGEILLYNKNIWDDPKKIRLIRSMVGLVFQYPEYQLFEETVYEDIAFGPKNMGISGEELDTRVKEISRIVGLDESFLNKAPFDLSGGEKRRVAIAGVLAMRPEIIVFDEPVAGLDPQGRNMVINIIRDYRNAFDATVIIVSHNMEDMAILADSLVVMNEGEIAICGKTADVFSKVKELQSIGLNVPMVTQVFFELKKLGADVPDDILTVDSAVEFLQKKIKGGEQNA